ncbi:unnamed protein product, partial [Phaeothamnion confervicola]
GNSGGNYGGVGGDIDGDDGGGGNGADWSGNDADWGAALLSVPGAEAEWWRSSFDNMMPSGADAAITAAAEASTLAALRAQRFTALLRQARLLQLVGAAAESLNPALHALALAEASDGGGGGD